MNKITFHDLKCAVSEFFSEVREEANECGFLRFSMIGPRHLHVFVLPILKEDATLGKFCKIIHGLGIYGSIGLKMKEWELKRLVSAAIMLPNGQ